MPVLEYRAPTNGNRHPMLGQGCTWWLFVAAMTVGLTVVHFLISVVIWLWFPAKSEYAPAGWLLIDVAERFGWYAAMFFVVIIYECVVGWAAANVIAAMIQGKPILRRGSWRFWLFAVLWLGWIRVPNAYYTLRNFIVP